MSFSYTHHDWSIKSWVLIYSTGYIYETYHLLYTYYLQVISVMNTNKYVGPVSTLRTSKVSGSTLSSLTLPYSSLTRHSVTGLK